MKNLNILSPEIRFNPNTRALPDKHEWLQPSIWLFTQQSRLFHVSESDESIVDELFCADFLWFLCAHAGWPATNRSDSWHVNPKSTRYPPSAHTLLFFFYAPSINVLDERIRHACLLRAISMGGLDDSSAAGRSGCSMLTNQTSCFRDSNVVDKQRRRWCFLRRCFFASVALSSIDSRYSDRHQEVSPFLL